VPAEEIEAAENFDAATAVYVADCQDPFGLLCQAVSQMAGLLVLEATGAGRWALEHPMLDSVRKTTEEAAGQLAALRPTERARHHHQHMMDALDASQLALVSMERRRMKRADRSDPLGALRLAWDKIQRAGKALPGFEPLDLSQSCCAVHLSFRERAFEAGHL
jgi:hypothetical protein